MRDPRILLPLLVLACSSSDEAERLRSRVDELETRIQELEGKLAASPQAQAAPAPPPGGAAPARLDPPAEAPRLEVPGTPPESETVVVTVDAVGLRFHGRPVSEGELKALLKRRVDAGTDVSLVVEGSKDASPATVAQIVGTARALGIVRIARGHRK